MKVKTRFIIEVVEVLEIEEENKEFVLKAIEDKKPLFDEHERQNIIDSLAFELDANKENIKIKEEGYEIIEE